MAGTYDGSIRINTKLNTNGFNSGIKSMTASLGKLAGAVGIAFSVTALVKLGKQAVELASDITEVDNVVSKSFGNMRTEMDELADKAIESLGMSRLTAYQTGATFMAMGKSMVDSMSAAKDMALELTRLTGNMSSFYNVRQEIASTALKSIYTGETETLKQFGVVMTETNLQQFAFEQGIRNKISAMTQSEKVMLRYKYVTEQLSFIGNDFLDTQNSWANQTRILSEQWKELLSVLGTGLITVLTPVVKGLNMIISALISVANTIGQIMAKVFGIQAQQFGAAEVEDAYSGIAGSAGDAADATDEYGNALDKAGKKAKNSLASFDKIDKLQKDTGKSATGPGVGSGGTKIETSNLAPDESTIDKTNEKIGKMIERAKELGEILVEGFAEGFKTDKLDSLKDNLDSIRDTLKRIWTDPEVSKAREKYVDSTAEMLGTIAGAAASISVSLAYGVTKGVDEALKDTEEFSKKKMTSIYGNMTRANEYITEFAKAVAEIGTAFESEGFSNIISFFEKLGIYVDLTLLDTLTGLFADFVEILTKPISDNAKEWKDFLENIFELTSNLLGPFDELLDNLIKNSDAYENSWLHKMLNGFAEKKSEDTKKWLDILNSGLETLIEMTEGFNLEELLTVGPFKDEMVEFCETVDRKFYETLENIKTWFAELPYNIGFAIGQTGAEFSKWYDDTKDWFDEKLPELIKEMAVHFAVAAVEFLMELMKFVDKLPEWKDSIITKWDELWPTIGNHIKDYFLGLKDDAIEYGKQLITGFANGFNIGWAEIKDFLMPDFCKDVLDGFRKGFDINSPSKRMKEIGEYLIAGLKIAIGNDDAGTEISAFTENVLSSFTGSFNYENFHTIGMNSMSGLLDSFSENSETWDELMAVWWEESVTPWFTSDKWYEELTGFREGVNISFEDMKLSWDDAMLAWWTESVAPWFMVERWQKLGESVRNGMYVGVKGMVTDTVNLLNMIIIAFEQMANESVRSLNKIIKGYNKIAAKTGESSIGSVSDISLDRIQIPKLAQGAVIPPNSQFLALLGDQTKGPNIEAPASLIKEMSKEGILESGIIEALRSSGVGEAKLILDGEVAGRMILPHILNEWKRSGYNITVLE